MLGCVSPRFVYQLVIGVMSNELILNGNCFSNLPQGVSAAALHDCAYVVPGLFQYSSLVYRFMEQVRAKFAYSIPIANIFGAPNVRWNGGRLMKASAPDYAEVARELDCAFDHGVQPLLTFTNLEITKLDLQDRLCNAILALLQARGGAVLVASSLLHNYIRQKYPNIQIHASVLMSARVQKRTAEFYQDLAKSYDRFVIHPDDLRQSALMAEIAMDNAEFIVNERCLPGCSQRLAHYESISREQKAHASGEHLDERFLDGCPFIPEPKQRSCRFRNLSLTLAETQALVNVGLRYVKLQGRTDSPELMFFDLHRYMLEPDIAFPHMYCIFQPQIERYLAPVRIPQNRKENI